MGEMGQFVDLSGADSDTGTEDIRCNSPIDLDSDDDSTGSDDCVVVDPADEESEMRKELIEFQIRHQHIGTIAASADDRVPVDKETRELQAKVVALYVDELEAILDLTSKSMERMHSRLQGLAETLSTYHFSYEYVVQEMLNRYRN